MKSCNQAKIHPCGKLAGQFRPPGDKSISHRVAMFSALATGTSTISGFLRSEDCLNTVKAMQALGAETAFDGELLRITGKPWRRPKGVLDVGNSGTSMRLLAGLLAARPWTSELTGDESLCSRPMKRIQEPLELMGARVELLGNNDCAPMRITGGKLRAMEYVMPVASAQVKSCILLAALFAEGKTRVVEPLPTRDHTERLMKSLGVPLSINGSEIVLDGFGPQGPKLPARAWMVPGDFSSSAFCLVASAAMPGASVNIEGVGLNPRRTALLGVLRRMGAVIKVGGETLSSAGEPHGELSIKGGRLCGTVVGGAEIPNIIDELPLVAVAGALAKGTTVICDARELRLKESDRIASIAENLKRVGVACEEREDGLVIQGSADIRGNLTLDSFGDHRIAMALAILGLYADGPVIVNDVACVDTSYPQFWNHLRSLGAHVELDRDH